jgi:hypothetical protein
MSIDAKRSTSEIRMIAAEVVKQQLKVCGVERARMNDRIAQNTKSIDEMDQAELIANMRATWSEFKGEVRTQIRITWVLLLLILSSLVGVAFSVWGKGP